MSVWAFYPLVLVFTAVGVVDMLTTVYALENIGVRELNPVIQWFMEVFGIRWGALLAFLIVIAPGGVFTAFLIVVVELVVRSLWGSGWPASRLCLGLVRFSQ